MTVDSLLHKAVLLLDLKNDALQAESVLREARHLAESTGEPRALLRTNVILGELLLQLGRDSEGKELLRSVAAHELTEGLQCEIRRAQTLLGQVP